jgi:hypothetical protein
MIVAITELAWWAVQWPWLTVWMVGALAAVTAGAITLQCWRRYDPTVGTPMRGDRIYLDRDGLLDAAVDWAEGPRLAMPQKVVLTKSRTRKQGLASSGLPINAHFTSEQSSESVEHHLAPASNREEPASRALITVARQVQEGLRQRGELTYLDLAESEVILSKSLSRKQNRLGRGARSTVSLPNIKGYVLIYGPFGRTDLSGRTFVSTGTASERVRIECVSGDTLTEDTSGSESLHCLGRVRRWDREASHLVVRGLALFGGVG